MISALLGFTQLIKEYGNFGTFGVLIFVWLKIGALEKKVDARIDPMKILITTVDLTPTTLQEWTKSRDMIILQNSLETGVYNRYNYPGFAFANDISK